MLNFGKNKEFTVTFQGDSDPKTIICGTRIGRDEDLIIENAVRAKRMELHSKGMDPNDPQFARLLMDQERICYAYHLNRITNYREDGVVIEAKEELAAVLKEFPAVEYQQLIREFSSQPGLGEFERKG